MNIGGSRERKSRLFNAHVQPSTDYYISIFTSTNCFTYNYMLFLTTDVPV